MAAVDVHPSAEELEQLDRLPLSERDAEKHEQAITAEITALWQTDEVRRRRPTVRDEIKMGLDYYPSVLLETLARLYEDLADDFREAYGGEWSARDLPRVLRFGSWIGGDRDGNPWSRFERPEPGHQPREFRRTDGFRRSRSDAFPASGALSCCRARRGIAC